MSYFIEFAAAVTGLLDDADRVPRHIRDIVIDGLTDELGRTADYYLRTRPRGHESLLFNYDYPHPDIGSWQMFAFDFICDGSALAQGVVRVVYVDLTVSTLGDR